MNIYISNLSFDVNDSDLKELFEEYGTVSSAKVITDRYTGKSRGFGFVEMDDNTHAQQAIDDLNQAEFDGKTINVSVAKPRTERSNRNSYSNQSKGGYHSERRNRY